MNRHRPAFVSPRAVRAASLAAAATLALGCACVSPATNGANAAEMRAAAPGPEALLPADALPGAFLWRQTVSARWGEDEQRSFDAVVQRTGATLTVLGLSPTGNVGFSVVLAGREVELTNNMPDAFPIDPRFILLDVQRAFYPWLDDGQEVGETAGERVRETRADGRLIERRFTSLDGEQAPVVVRFDWSDDATRRAPATVELTNERFGYRLSITTYDERELAE